MRRATAREFQKGFQRLEEPVLVNDGIWFPEATDELIAIAEGQSVVPAAVQLEAIMKMARGPRKSSPDVVGDLKPRYPKLDLSKTAQAKGRMGHR